jgi:putative transposase
MVMSYKYRIYPTLKQVTVIEHQLDSCRHLYNAALEHRITAYKAIGKFISYQDQQDELPFIRADYPEFKNIHSQVLQNILRRLDRSFQNFYRRLKRGEEPGFPRFKGKDHFDSMCYPQSGFRLNGCKVELSKIGNIKVKLHRPIEGIIKTCTIKKSAKQWHVIFTSEISNVVKKKEVCSAIGIDLGLESFATLSNGDQISNPRHLKKTEEKLKAVQSRYSLKKSKSAKRELWSLHRKIRNQRNDFLHKTSRKLVNQFDLVAYEDLDIKKMVEGKYAKSIHDAGWGKFIDMIKYKAESAGSYSKSVNPYHTSQTCSNCQALVKKEIHQRWHDCPACGLSLHRDHNAAINILKSGTDAVFQMPRQLAAG